MGVAKPIEKAAQVAALLARAQQGGGGADGGGDGGGDGAAGSATGGATGGATGSATGGAAGSATGSATGGAAGSATGGATGGATSRAAGGAAASAAVLLSPEVIEVKEVLRRHYSFLYNLFSYYAAIGGDALHLSLNQWSQFTNDYKLVSRNSSHCKKADMDRLFIAVDAAATRAAATGNAWQRTVAMTMDKKKALSRVEFFVAVINIALNKCA